MNARETLKVYFGYDSFREGQEEIVNSIVSGKDALAIMPTGAGKSICYQIPALMLPGITIVISPLISLMQDQVKALNNAGIHAAFINSTLNEVQISKALRLAANGTYKIIYVAPERLESFEFMEFAKEANISMVTIDEAHCISQWGQDFRPSYLKIVTFVEQLKNRPIVSAFTATATNEVKNDILCILNLNHPKIVVTGFDRENLYYRVEHIKNKDVFIREYAKKHMEESGIIYCATRKNVDNVYDMLLQEGIRVTKYHAGIDLETRKKNQEDFIYDRTPVIVATNAFGMGIDKSNVRYVIHYNMPQSMENYYQEAGRAGRDGEPSQCILLFSAQDIIINKFLLEKKDFSGLEFDDIKLVKQRDAKRLLVMEGYCKTTGCLRNYILNYFGEKTGKPCEQCGNCHREYKEVDMTKEAKWVINCVAETKGKYGLTIVLGMLVGANRARLRELGTIQYKSYGALKDYNEATLRELIAQMIEEGYLYQTEEQYSVLKMGNISPLKNEDAKVVIRTYEEKEMSQKNVKRRSSTDCLTAAGYELFETLRRLRFEIAKEEALPPYIIFNDKTLIDFCVKLPQNDAQMLNVSGVGTSKLGKYGERFLEAIKEFQEKHVGAILSIQEEGNTERLSPSVTKRSGKRKEDFYITENDREKFIYKDFYYASEIKEELNRICSVSNVKKLTFTVVWKYLVMEGITYEKEVNGQTVKYPTQKGIEYGIVLEDKVNSVGVPYQLLLYPQKIQEMIVENFVGKRIENTIFEIENNTAWV